MTNAELNINRLFSLKKVLENELVRLEKQDVKFDSTIKKILAEDTIDTVAKDKVEKRRLISKYRSKKLGLVLAEVRRLIKEKEDEGNLPDGVEIDPKKQIFISKIDYEKSPRLTNKEGEEIVATHGHIKNLRKKDYYENRVRNQFN